jgi:hypothetical protein
LNRGWSINYGNGSYLNNKGSHFDIDNLSKNDAEFLQAMQKMGLYDSEGIPIQGTKVIYGTGPDVGIGGGVKSIVSALRGGKELFKFSAKAAQHMSNTGRAVPIQILAQAIKGSKGLADPRGSRALLHTTEMWKNGKAYNLEVLYDKTTNTIWHFQYSSLK